MAGTPQQPLHPARPVLLLDLGLSGVFGGRSNAANRASNSIMRASAASNCPTNGTAVRDRVAAALVKHLGETGFRRQGAVAARRLDRAASCRRSGPT
jgi:hypothetical protein